MNKKERIQLTEGSVYKVTSLASKDKPMMTSGKFMGFTVVGNMDAICMELDKTHKTLKGKLRIIPTHMVMSIDIVTARKAKVEKERAESVFYR